MGIKTNDNISCAEGDGFIPACRLNNPGVCPDLNIQKFSPVFLAEGLHERHSPIAGAAVNQYDFRFFMGIGLHEKII